MAWANLDGTIELISNPGDNPSFVLTNLISECAAKAAFKLQQLDAIAISAGPGSYTGLRVAYSVAKGLCLGLSIPLIEISTLVALAAASMKSFPGKEILHLAMIDARRMEVSAALYDHDGKLIEHFPDLILNEGAFAGTSLIFSNLVLSGTGTDKWVTAGLSPDVQYSGIGPSARLIAESALIAFEESRFSQATLASPIYFKKPNITTSKRQLFS